MAADAECLEDLHDLRGVCYQSIREQRFDGAVVCTECESTDIVTEELTEHGMRQYFCRTCQSEFTDLTGTIFDELSLSIEALLYIYRHHTQSTIQSLAEILDSDHEPVREAHAAFEEESLTIDLDTICEVYNTEHGLLGRTSSGNTITEEEEQATSQTTNQYVDVRVLEPSRRQLRTWKNERDLTYDTAINELLDQIALADISLGPNNAPKTEAQTDENRVIISMRRNTRDRLNIWKTERGFTYNEAILVLVDTVSSLAD